jgi:paraquat-inducible protein B
MKSRLNHRPNALRIGVFAIGGLLLLLAAVVTVFGSHLFARTEVAVMHFSSSVHGLQVGSPVVFRGVRLGRVVSLGIVHDAGSGAFSVPVRAEIDRSLIQDPQGHAAADHKGLALAALVARGLRAQLASQSLLTGQMFIDLDLPNIAPANGMVAGTGQTVTATVIAPIGADGAVVIPTKPSSIDGFIAQLQGLDLRGLVAELSAAAASTKQLIGSPQLQKAIEDLAGATRTLQSLGNTLERRVGPLADAAQATLGDTRRAASNAAEAGNAATRAAERVGSAADQLGAAAGRVNGLLAPESPLLQRVQNAADELARSAVALRQATADDGALVQNMDRALQDVSRASRTVRELADLLQREPEALLRGRANAP